MYYVNYLMTMSYSCLRVANFRYPYCPGFPGSFPSAPFGSELPGQAPIAVPRPRVVRLPDKIVETILQILLLLTVTHWKQRPSPVTVSENGRSFSYVPPPTASPRRSRSPKSVTKVKFNPFRTVRSSKTNGR